MKVGIIAEKRLIFILIPYVALFINLIVGALTSEFWGYLCFGLITCAAAGAICMIFSAFFVRENAFCCLINLLIVGVLPLPLVLAVPEANDLLVYCMMAIGFPSSIVMFPVIASISEAMGSLLFEQNSNNISVLIVWSIFSMSSAIQWLIVIDIAASRAKTARHD